MQEILHKKSIIKQNILQYIDFKGISKYNFYKNTGITRGVLDQDTGISEDNIARFIAYFPEVNTNWLLTGNGEMLRGINPLSRIETKKHLADKGGVPYYDLLPVSAGDLMSQLSQSSPTSFIDLPQLKGCTAILPVFGNSMKGVVEPGDLIAIKEIKSRDEFDPAMPYLVITDEHRMIKYLHLDESDNSLIWAESTNHARIKLNIDSIKMVYAIKCVVRFF